MRSGFDLNLSTRPFPAYRAINIALVGILLLLVAVSAWQGVYFTRYSKKARAIRGTEQELRVDAEALGQQVADLGSRLDKPESTAKLNEIEYLNYLIYRRNFSWTRLFAILEDMVPDNVHLVNLTPNIGTNGSITLSIGLKAHSISDATVFIKRLEESPIFEKVIVSVEQKTDPNIPTDVDLKLTTIYDPQKDVR